ncbi:hypothetical protein Q4493_05485 [Colwellia sp. 1_MG-2023]|uniref:hypothetical protein n=1 Tax=Colwellia sp. 1_MG-2023 TaxID=3062649 RepID=UPI0026E1B8B7|nr:hypothetical protein [Colwellia sp. 1_MG-2023]MDO6445224.1 hypothetical protein [Colwellia sp. 1_MG-2023]
MYSSNQIESITAELRHSLGDNIPWKYEDKMAVMLSEFAQNKSDVVFEKLKVSLTDEWHSKTVKKMPKALKKQLGDLAKLSKNQKILAVPAQDSTPALVALWWPWDHGGTYSLRLKVLEQSYDNTLEPSTGLLSWCKNLFSS